EARRVGVAEVLPAFVSSAPPRLCVFAMNRSVGRGRDWCRPASSDFDVALRVQARSYLSNPDGSAPLGALLFLVHDRRVEEAVGGVGELEGRVVEVGELAIETALVAVVAGGVGGAGLLDLHKDDVLVAIGVELLDPLHVA